MALFVVVFVSACAVADVRARRIPNALTAPAMVFGLVVHATGVGGAGAWAGLSGLLVVGGALFVPFALGGIGAGDVKMMAAVGSMLGPRLGFAALLLGMISGGIIMVGHLARRGQLREKLAATGRMVLLAAGARSVDPLRLAADGATTVALPYGVPLAIGTVAALVLAGTKGGL